MSCLPNHTVCERDRGHYLDMAAHWLERHGERWRHDPVSMVGVASLTCPGNNCTRAFGSQRALDLHIQEQHSGETFSVVWDPSEIYVPDDAPAPAPRKEASMAPATCPVPGCDKPAKHRGRHVGGGTLSDIDRKAGAQPKADKPSSAKARRRAGLRARRSGVSPNAVRRSQGLKPAPKDRGLPVSNGHVELNGAEAALVFELLSERKLRGATIAELDDADHLALQLAAKIRGAAKQ